EDGIRDRNVTGVQTCALPISSARGSRLNVWNTNPISLLRIRASSSSLKSLTFWPLSQYSPLVGVSRQPIRFMSVDFPDPDGPIRSEERRVGKECRARASTCHE